MSIHRIRVHSRSGGLWLIATAVTTGLVLVAPTVFSQTPANPGANPAQPTLATPIANLTAPDVQTLNRALMVERVLARFFTLNADKAFLTGIAVATNPPTVLPGTGGVAGNLQPASSDDLPFTATLSGSDEVPPVNTPASGVAGFILRKDRRAVDYEVRLTGLSSAVTAIHLHQAKRGEPGGIIHQILSNPVNGVSAGQFGLRPEEFDPLTQGQFFIEIHTEQHPLGELRGQLVMGTAGTAPALVSPGGTTIPPVTVPVISPAGSREPLRQIVNEIRDHHNAHVAFLEQALAGSAQAAPAFQNLDAPTLEQFLTMAVTLEDFAPGAHQLLFTTAVGANPPAAATPQVVAVLAAIALDDARHAGALRAYRKIVSTAEGGIPDLLITDEGALSIPRTQAQIDAFVQLYVAAAGTNPQAPATNPPATGTSPPATGGNPPVTGGNPPVY
jgi:hypothetical protein